MTACQVQSQLRAINHSMSVKLWISLLKKRNSTSDEVGRWWSKSGRKGSNFVSTSNDCRQNFELATKTITTNVSLHESVSRWAYTEPVGWRPSCPRPSILQQRSGRGPSCRPTALTAGLMWSSGPTAPAQRRLTRTRPARHSRANTIRWCGNKESRCDGPQTHRRVQTLTCCGSGRVLYVLRRPGASSHHMDDRQRSRGTASTFLLKCCNNKHNLEVLYTSISILYYFILLLHIFRG